MSRKNSYLADRTQVAGIATSPSARPLPAISMETLKRILILSLLAIVFSCKQAEAPAEEAPVIEPISTFDAPFPKNNKQLSKIFGNLLIVKSNSDTLFLKITSSKNDNLITDTRSGDTIFFGKACKFREFYYFSQKVNDTSYYISAFRIKHNLIYGLNCSSQYYDVDENIIKGNSKELIKFINSDTSLIRLKPNKKELRKLFGLIMSKAIPDTILNSETDLNKIAERESSFEKETEEIENKIKVYPNPAIDHINVETKRKCKYLLTDINGKVVMQGNLGESENRINISNNKTGIYLLTVTEIQNNEKQTVKIMIR